MVNGPTKELGHQLKNAAFQADQSALQKQPQNTPPILFKVKVKGS